MGKKCQHPPDELERRVLSRTDWLEPALAQLERKSTLPPSSSKSLQPMDDDERLRARVSLCNLRFPPDIGLQERSAFDRLFSGGFTGQIEERRLHLPLRG